jgi:hypothetical protein
MVTQIDERARLYHQHQRLNEAFNILNSVYYESAAADQSRMTIEQALAATRLALEETDNELRAIVQATEAAH